MEHEGEVHHAEFQFNNYMVMAGQTNDDASTTPAMLYFYVKDCDAAYKIAMDGGASSILESKD